MYRFSIPAFLIWVSRINIKKYAIKNCHLPWHSIRFEKIINFHLYLRLINVHGLYETPIPVSVQICMDFTVPGPYICPYRE